MKDSYPTREQLCSLYDQVAALGEQILDLRHRFQDDWVVCTRRGRCFRMYQVVFKPAGVAELRRLV